MPIDTENQCSNCKSDLYKDEKLADHIRHLRINDNSKIMVHMLNIMSNLQKRRSDEVVKIIEKTFLEAYSEKVFEPIKPTFDLIHFIVFNLVEDYDYVKLTQIFIDFLKKSLKVDMNLTEILMLYLFKDNLILSNEKGQVYDYLNTSAIYKRQICTSGVYSKEKKMLVKYLSLSTSFLAGEPQISDMLIEELTSDVNNLCRHMITLPSLMVKNMIHFPLYFTQVYSSIEHKIKIHAQNSNIPPGISELILNFTRISIGIENWMKEFEHFLRKSPTFSLIKKKFDLSLEELFGVIYLMKGDTQNEYFDKIISSTLKKSNLLSMKNSVDILLNLYASKDESKINKSLLVFKRYCTKGDKQFNLLTKFFWHFNGKRNYNMERLRLWCLEFYEMLPSKRPESDTKLKTIFFDSISMRNLAKFRTFRENMLFISKGKSSSKMEEASELVSILNILELFLELNLGTSYKEMISKLKEFIPEFEVNSLFEVCMKLLKTINGFKASTKDLVSDRLKDSFNSLAEILIGRPHDFEQLWIMIYSSDHAAKLKALNYFVEVTNLSSGVENDRFKFHAIYIDKRVKFMNNQSKFIRSFAEDSKHPAFKFGMVVVKRMFMRNFQISSSEIRLLLTRIVNKLDPSTSKKDMDSSEEQDEFNKQEPDDKPVESSKLTRFYFSLMDFIVNQSGQKLGNYFLEDHNEPMLKILAFCRYCNNPNEIVNKIFDHLIKNGHVRLCSLMYLYYIIIGLIQRRKIHHKYLLEQEISAWLKIKPEFMEFIELYIDRDPSSIVDMLFKIQNRIFTNLYSDQEQQKARVIMNTILSRDFYQNFDNIISGTQPPSLSYLSDLFKIPYKKLKFIYTLTTLKLNSNLDNVFEQFMNNQDMRKALDMQVINPQELDFLLKICLNQIDYDSITDLLRLMKLDQVIIPEILINLLLLDLKVDKKSLSIKDFNQTLLVHSAIFEKLEDTKEICWAFARVLKGDFLIFSEVSDALLNKDQPQNHKYFSSIMKGFVGVKNFLHSDDRTEKVAIMGGIPNYCSMINSHFSRFKKGDQENSLEYALFVLHDSQDGFKLHPVWKLLVDSFNDSKLQLKQENDPKKYHQIPFLKDSKENNQASLMNFIVIYNLVNSDESVLEFIHDLAFFRNILKFLKSPEVTERIEPYQNLRLVQFYEGLVKEYKDTMKKMIKDKKLIFDYEHFAKKNNLLFQGFLMDACKTSSFAQPADFYLHMNTIVFQVWKQDLHRRSEDFRTEKEEKEKIDRLTKKIEELFRDNKMMFDPFTMFVTHENEKTKDYWDRIFEEVEYLDDYLDSLAEYFLVSLDQVNSHLSRYKLTNSYLLEDYHSKVTSTGANEDDEEEHSEEDDDDISTAKEEYNEQRKMKQMMKAKEEEKKKEEVQMSVEWAGLPIYILLDRLRSYQNLSSDDKLEKVNEITNKSNILFGILEKALFMSNLNSGYTFRKFNYLREFCLTIGVKLPENSWLDYSASLFSPEISVYKNGVSSDISSNADHDPTKQTLFDPNIVLVKSIVIKDVYKNDLNYYPNRGIFSLYCYEPNSSQGFVNDRINLAIGKAELNIVHAAKRAATSGTVKSSGMASFYVFHFLSTRKPDQSSEREELFKDYIQEERIRDPSSLSIYLLDKDYYDTQLMKNERDKERERSKIKNKSKESSNAYISQPFKKLREEFFSDFLSGDSESKKEWRRKTRDNNNELLKESTIKFLNDIALNKYSVLSETKNIFTEHIELATYQKIYESILHLHSSKRIFDRQVLLTSLKTLSPYLSSNIYNLNSVLEFVVEPVHANVTKSDNLEKTRILIREYHLFREMGIKNNSFFHIFLLHTYSNVVRMQYIKKIIEDLGIIDYVKIKPTIANLLNLCYLVKSDRDSFLSKYEFKDLADGILGTKTEMEEEERSEKRRNRMGMIEETEEDETNLVSFIYKRINLKDTKKSEKHIEKFYTLVANSGQDLGQHKVDKQYLRFVLFNKFITSITGKNKKHFLLRFESDFQNINEVFGVKNWSLMSVFDIINMVTTSRPENVQSNLPKSTQNCQTFFQLLKSSKEEVKPNETFSELLTFICAFYKFDIEGILKFLKNHGMENEYCFVISYYCYIGILNGWWDSIDEEDSEEIGKDLSAKQKISLCLCYPMIQQLYSTVVLSDFSKNPITEQLKIKHNSLVEQICSFESLKFLDGFMIVSMRKDKLEDGQEAMKRSSSNIDLLFKGSLFKPFQEDIDHHMSEFMNISENNELKKAIMKLKYLFLFRPQFYLSLKDDRESRESNQALNSLISSAYYLRDQWEDLNLEIEKNFKSYYDSTQTTTNELLGQIRALAKGKSDFSFMNVREDDEAKMVLQNYIFVMMVFVFIYLKEVRKHVNINDNNAQLIVMKQSVNFVWKLISNMAGESSSGKSSSNQRLAVSGYVDPIKELNISDYGGKVDFLDKYTHLLYVLKKHGSDTLILKELLKFVRNYVFGNSDRSSNGSKKSRKVTQDSISAEDETVEGLVSSLKLDSFMELYDYLEELENGREISENYKENIVNLFVQIMSQYDRFKKHISDIRAIVKLIQGDYSKIDHFVEKLFTRSENV